MSETKHTIIVHAGLDRYFPPRGECAFCGHVDARHRLWDVLINSPDSHEGVAWWYNVPVEAVRLVRELQPYHRKRRRKYLRRSAP